MKKRVGYLTSQYPAPSHTFIRREVEAMRARGFDVSTYSVRRLAPDETRSDADVAAERTTFYVLPAGLKTVVAAHWRCLRARPGRYFATLQLALRHRAPGVKALLWALFYFAETMVLVGQLERQRVEHLHNHFANAAANVGFLAAFFLDLPWSFTMHGTSELDYPAGLLLADKIAAARFVACVSHFGRAQAMRASDPDHWSKLFVSRCGLDLSALPEQSNRQPHRRLRVVSVGRLSPEKGQHGLFEGFWAAVEQGLDAELAVIGDGPDRGRLQALLRSHEQGDRIKLLGSAPEEDTLEVIGAADVLVMFSFMEGLPVVLMEALALRVPVIAPRVAGIPELVEDHVTGLLFHPGDIQGFTEALMHLGQDAYLRQRLGDAGRTRVEQMFAIEVATAPLAARFGADFGEHAAPGPQAEGDEDDDADDGGDDDHIAADLRGDQVGQAGAGDAEDEARDGVA